MRTARAVVFVLAGLVLGAAILVPAVRAERMAPIRREARSLAQQKISDRLMYEVARRRGDTAARGSRRNTGVRVDRHGRAYVAVHAAVVLPVEKKITALGGRIVSKDNTYETLVVWMPLMTVERLAEDGAIRSISPAD